MLMNVFLVHSFFVAYKWLSLLQATIFCKGTDNTYFRFCRPSMVYVMYPLFLFLQSFKNIQNILKF